MAKKAAKIAVPTERQRLRELARAARGTFPQLALGIGDDAALLRVPAGHEIAVTTDFSLEGVHFRREWHSAQSAGHRCLARGLSDLAAMGAEPVAAFLSLALPRELAGAWADDFFSGVLGLARQHQIPLAGGDLTRSPKAAVADIVVVGSVPRGQAMLRSTARAGDLLYVTGKLGGAAAELVRIAKAKSAGKTAKKSSAAHPHLFPQPRIAAGLALRQLGSRVACMDISDGLALDLARLCDASSAKISIAAELDEAALPIARGATLAQAMTGGEDYELLFTAPPHGGIPAKLGGVAVTRIGRITDRKRGQPQLTLVSASGKRSTLAARGWESFT
jgi:thiamine-monophosphate kinase